MIIYRTMKAQELQKVYELWDDFFPHNPISIGELNYLLFFNETVNCSLYWLACEGDNIAGVACGSLDNINHIGYIQFIGVKKDFRKQGIASKLMEKLLNEISRQGAKEVFFSGYPRNYLVPGLDTEKYPFGLKLFEKFGFTPVSRPVSMHILLDSYQPPEIKIPQEFSIVPFGDEHFAPVLCLCNDHLQSEWAEVVQIGYIRGGYSCNGFVCLCKNEVVGFAFYGMVSEDVRRFGPTGVHPEFRGHSLGKALLHSCLEAQKKAGYEKCYFLWGDENSAAVNMYTKNGFSITNNMTILRKKLS